MLLRTLPRSYLTNDDVQFQTLHTRRISHYDHYALHSYQTVANRPISQIAASLAGTGPGDRTEKAGFHTLSGRRIAVDYSRVSAINRFNSVRSMSVFLIASGDARMHKFKVLAIVAVVTMSVYSGATYACGESMFRVGKGVHYRAFSAPIPGSVLVFARTDSERVVAEDLRAAGHSVSIVASDDELVSEMQDHDFDVVVAPYSKREVVEAQSPEIAAHPNWVPVVVKGSADQRLARAEFGNVVTTDADVRKYLKAIHKTLKANTG
jgi:hypothetical protein